MVDTTFILAATGLLALAYAINLYIDFKRYEAAMGYANFSHFAMRGADNVSSMLQ
jgi:hypothetical protein